MRFLCQTDLRFNAELTDTIWKSKTLSLTVEMSIPAIVLAAFRQASN